MQWLRWYRGTVEDAKFRHIARRAKVSIADVIATWAVLLEDAACDDHRGVVTRDEDWIATILDFEGGVAETILAAMQDVNMITVGMNSITIVNWDTRQFESDRDGTAAERQKRKRERDKARNADVTRDTSVSHGPVTRPETDTDTETDTETDKSVSPVPGGKPSKYPPDFEEFWKAYPRNANMSKAAALKSWRKVAKQLPPLPDLLKAVAGYKAFVAREYGKTGKAYTVKHAEGWLSDQRWEPYLETAPLLAASVAKPDWADEIPAWHSFKCSIPATIWANFFAECSWDQSGMTLRAPSAFVGERILQAYHSQLRAIFGSAFQVIVVTAKSAA